ncbi:MAG: aldo/keto reductase [Clostridia bacterium]|nr:aldo/keto reductase [Clostridia bacterium]
MRQAPFEGVKGALGFGCMRFPKVGDEVDRAQVSDMIDAFMDAGFNYFDTSYIYLGGQSELILRECLTQRYERESFVLADKLSDWVFEKEEEVLPLFEKQLEQCGVDYFDVYFFHSITKSGYEKHLRCNTFEIVQKLKAEGKVRHIAMSFHDEPELLDRILTDHPCIEMVQLQINYLDYDDPTVQSKACYDVAVKHGKPVIVMEPIRGGLLATPPAQAAELLDAVGGSYASIALRYAAGFDEVFMVLSGMSSVEMVRENVQTFAPFVPLSPQELAIVDRVRPIIRESRQIPCTKCNYCADVCPKRIAISDIFSAYNGYLTARLSAAQAKEQLPAGASLKDCIGCGKCEEVCPQSIDIRKKLKRAGFELL